MGSGTNNPQKNYKNESRFAQSRTKKNRQTKYSYSPTIIKISSKKKHISLSLSLQVFFGGEDMRRLFPAKTTSTRAVNNSFLKTVPTQSGGRTTLWYLD